jgi:hypothetical protein
VDVEFLQLREDGTVDARPGPDWPIFNEALADAISSLPPRGSNERRLSTYWIDNTLDHCRRLRRAAASGPISYDAVRITDKVKRAGADREHHRRR